MIRLPATSISLSERDIDFHLRQAELYHGLRKQGFKKDDVVRYLRDYREAAAQTAGQHTDGFNLSAPSTVELSIGRPHPSSPSNGDLPLPSKQGSDHSSSTAPTSSSSIPFPDFPSDFTEPESEAEQLINHKIQNVDDDRKASPTPMPPSLNPNQHAPRQSSLLRFAQAASPERLAVDTEDGTTGPTVVFTPKAKKYRRRSTTHPYQSSERESAGETYAFGQVLDRMSRMSLGEDDHNDKLESSSFTLPPTYSASVETSSASDLQFASPLSEDGSEDSSSVTFVRMPIKHRRSSSLLGRGYSIADVPSSPPLPTTPAREFTRQARASSDSSQLPTTPTPIRNASSVPQIEPRPYRQQLDGHSFSVYNDSLPASTQPGTPADLSRQPLITEHDAAYTAPPAMIRSGHHGHRAWERDIGEQSPTARAMTLRSRRNRELTRSVIAEGVRLNRLMMRDEAMFTQRRIRAAAAANEDAEVEALPQIPDDVWRDNLDADRVGEENFDAGLDVGGRRVMRAVSGNARFDT
ncbi:hypothetical protein A1O7_07940 [Cladophialophora yegresii CBS 114405]|uniref:Uncharacterized protein n=1 Tax=Cladophialophora yegresii CBS 114405 TaxID=1182544 RepID=W9VPC7_9EURO|nr:uncharacterized protein A1O7_07940 [Cladophialophora yegresii CBS 114405]EXJ57592.1 hypothetical protein A1O7_07940 [Cladophialophora yegresii CBS 114405]